MIPTFIKIYLFHPLPNHQILNHPPSTLKMRHNHSQRHHHSNHTSYKVLKSSLFLVCICIYFCISFLCVLRTAFSHYKRHIFHDLNYAKFSDQVFVAMHTTQQLSWFIKFEAWGEKNSLLFKYLDYTFRSAAYRNEIYIFQQNIHLKKQISSTENDSTYDLFRSETRLVFNTGLKARTNGSIIYLILTRNQKKSVQQQWRVGYGNPCKRSNPSFVSKEWLMNNILLPNNLVDKDLPQLFTFDINKFLRFKKSFRNQQLLIIVDFQQIVSKYWDRIYNEYKKRVCYIFIAHNLSLCININLYTIFLCIEPSYISIPNQMETVALFTKSFNAICKHSASKHVLLTPMMYVDSYNTQQSIEYMLPLMIELKSSGSGKRNQNKNRIWFAAALVKRDNLKAQVMSILSPDMAYANARLIDRVQLPWLQRLCPRYQKVKKQSSLQNTHKHVHF